MGNFFTSLFSGNSESAEETKAKEDKKNFDIFKYDGIRAQKMGQVAYAIKCFQEALKLQSDFETKNYLAAAYIAMNQLEEASLIYDQMVSEEPDHLPVWISRANLAYMMERYEAVIEGSTHVIEADDVNANAFYLRAKAHQGLNDLINALADLTRTIALKDDFMEAYLSRAEVLLAMRQEAEALEDVERALVLSPEEEGAYLLRGSIHESMGDTEAAREDYQYVLDLNPFNEDAYLKQGKLLISENKLVEAVAFFTEAIELKPDFAKAYAERGRAFNLQGKSTEALEDLKQAINLDPQGEEAKKLEGQHANFDSLYKGGIF